MFRKMAFVAITVVMGALPPTLMAGSCEPLEGYDELLGHHLIMVGEMHGTREVPSYFGQLVCTALDRDTSVAVGLELPVSMAPALDRYMNSGEPNSVDTLLSDPVWSTEWQDGRTSQAMLDLIQELARLQLRHEGQLSVHLLDPPDEYRDGAMSKGQSIASRIRQMADETDADYLLTLTGNFHNRINVPPEQSATSDLADLDPFTVTLNWQEGQAWMCTGSTPDGCGVIDLPDRGADMGSARVVVHANADSKWHARLDVPVLSSSPPAVEESRADSRQ